MKILITGAAGFIGSHLAKYFHIKHEVYGIDLSPSANVAHIDAKNYHQVDMINNSFKEIVISIQPEFVIHCAGRSSVGQSFDAPFSDFEATTLITAKLLEIIRKTNLFIKVIFLSSAAVYGNPNELPVREESRLNPISPYGYHKLFSEKLIFEYSKIFSIQASTIRLFSVYGPGLKRQVLWDVGCRCLTKKFNELFGTGFESRDFIYITDVVRSIELIMQKSEFKCEIYNVASGVETTIKDLAEMIYDNLGADTMPSFDGQNHKGNPTNWRANISKIKNLGFEPSVPIEEGVRRYCHWLKSNFID